MTVFIAVVNPGFTAVSVVTVGDMTGLNKEDDGCSVGVYGKPHWRKLNWNIFAKKLSVPQSDTSRTINAYDILVKLTHLNDYSCLIPLAGE
jgi:hypothetical protein